MIDYFNKTKHKLFAGVILGTLIFIVVLLILAVALVLSKADMEAVENWMEVTLYAFLMSAGLSLFIMVLAFFTSYHEYTIKERMFSRQPFNQLITLGFQKVKILDKTYWVLIEEVFVAKINQYWIVVDTLGKKQVRFNFLHKTPHLSDLKNIETGVRDARKEYNLSGLTISVQPDEFWTPGINEIKSMIESVTLQLQSSGMVPHGEIHAYEKEVKGRLIQKAFAGVG